ncbi:hypothetical protein PQ478_09225 [Alkalihalophilus pseudofirmus]|uniref:hypothetical protein n=1 Tax=Alkalihalophilus pseudofirmus TaxID=79885 RepID=UPI00259BE65C|nr:hypothetical protein [Alkalihalophilus pseudofirmus]WEG18650.1 hypothetical protein PQ478_09225 [Alkalihalophilus pseudofirmus]
MTPEDKLKLISSMSKATVEKSSYSNQYYVSTVAQIKKDKTLWNVTKHKDTPEEAINCMFDEMKKADRIVVGAVALHRKEFYYCGSRKRFIEY